MIRNAGSAIVNTPAKQLENDVLETHWTKICQGVLRVKQLENDVLETHWTKICQGVLRVKEQASIKAFKI